MDFRRDEKNELQPIDLPLAPRAKEMWIEFYNEHARELCELSEDLAAAWSKLEGYAARFALLFHLVRVAAIDPTLIDSAAIDEVSMRAGIAVSRWFGDEASRIYSLLGAEGDLAEEVERRRLMRIVRDHSGEISPRDLMRASRKYRANAETAEAALNGLVQEGVGRWVSKPSGEHGGRPARVFRLMERCGPEGDKSIECEALGEVVSPSPLIGESQDTLLEPDPVKEGRDNVSEFTGETPDGGDGNTTPNNVEISEVSSPLANGGFARDPFEEFEL